MRSVRKISDRETSPGEQAICGSGPKSSSTLLERRATINMYVSNVQFEPLE